MQDFMLNIARKAYNMRRWSLIMTTQAESGHPTTCLSAADIVATLFFYTMHYNPDNPHDPLNDHFILSKGHASALLYAAWEQLGVLSEQDLLTYRKFSSPLEGHPTPRFAHAESATGSLGIGLSIGVGTALATRFDSLPSITYVLLGDGECAEGSVWEAAELAAFYHLKNVIAIVDANTLGQSDYTLYGKDTHRLTALFQAFGWQTYEVNGHDIRALVEVFDTISAHQHDRPSMVLARTVKGYGLPSVAGKNGFHGKAFSKQELDLILQELANNFPDVSCMNDKTSWHPRKHEGFAHALRIIPEIPSLPPCSYEIGSLHATRKAYGQALALLGDVDDSVIVLDAEVKNSTYAELFEAKHQDRFIQSFIAEQNMVGMAIGLALRGKKPFVSTFAAFITRAHDQLRMASISNAPLRVIGSHAGVSVGEDGPSQMGLEDIGLIRALPNSIVLYPCDAVSTHGLVQEMARYDKGISYLRTTRESTSVMYDADTPFTIGGCTVLKQSNRDVACVVAAGITVFEALKAYEELALGNGNILIALIDLYSIKPFDLQTIIQIAQKAQNRIITIEDHYRAGGMGEMIASALQNHAITTHILAVDSMPISGTASELRSYHGIDSAAIVKIVHTHFVF